MTDLLVTTPNYLLRYKLDTQQVFVVEAGRPEYYGVSWFAGTDQIFLSHSGLDNDGLQSVTDYMTSEVGWISRGDDESWAFLSAPHQLLCLDDGTIVVTNTGRNCLTIVNPTGWSIRNHRFDNVLWDRLDAQHQCGSHFNSVTAKYQFLYVLAHNYDRGSYILQLERPTLRIVNRQQLQGSGFHNLWLQDDGLMIACDTMRSALVSVTDNRTLWRSYDPSGLARGIAATKDQIFVGASINGARSTRRDSETGIWIVDAGKFATVDYHVLGHFGNVNEIRLLDQVDLCHPQGPLALSDYLIGTPANLFLAQRRLKAAEGRFSMKDWDILLGDLTGNADTAHFRGQELGLAVLRNSRSASFRVSGLLDVSHPRAQHCGLIGRYRGPHDTNMIAAILGRNEAGHAALGLWRENGAGWKCLDSCPIAGLSATVEFSGDGDRFTITCDGTEVIVAEILSVPTDGVIGVRSIGGTAVDIRSEMPGRE
jgi:hypothetical protein